MMSIISRHGPAGGLRLRFASLDAPSRRIHSTPLAAMSVKEKISQVADKVNKKVGEGLASAIETGEQATEKTKETLGTTTKRAEDKARAAERIGHKVKEAGNDSPSSLAKETYAQGRAR